MVRIYNMRHGNVPARAVRVDRNTIWGNPFSHLAGTRARFQTATREEAVREHRQWLLTQPQLLARLPELRGRDLACWCWPRACHAQTLAQLANAPEEA